MENNVKTGKILIADNHNNIVDITDFTITDMSRLLCCAIDETHYNVLMEMYDNSSSSYKLCTFKIDFSLPVKSWLSYIKETAHTTNSGTNGIGSYRNSSIFGRWAILIYNGSIKCYDFDTNTLFAVYSNSTSYKIYYGINYVKDNVLYYNCSRTQFAYDLLNKTMLNDASKKYEEYVSGEFRIQLDDNGMHVSYDNAYQWYWNFSTHTKTDETKTIPNTYPRYGRTYGSSTSFVSMTSPDTGKLITINDTYEVLQDSGEYMYVHNKTTDTWTSYAYFRYLFGEIKYYEPDNTTDYYAYPQINNNNPQALVWLYYETQSFGPGESYTSFMTKTIRNYKAYNLQSLNVPTAPITLTEYNTALDTTDQILGGVVPLPTDNLSVVNNLAKKCNYLEDGDVIDQAKSIVAYNPNVTKDYDKDNMLYDFGFQKIANKFGEGLDLGGYYFIVEKPLDENQPYTVMTNEGGLDGQTFTNKECTKYGDKYIYFTGYGSYNGDMERMNIYTDIIVKRK